MRYRLMALYDGSPYEAGIGPTPDDIVLFAACPPPEELGFEPATGHWRKQVKSAEVQAVWESRPVGVFGGRTCLVLDDLGDQLHIAYLGHDGVTAEQLGYSEVDRGVFELIAPRSEVTDIIEDRVEVATPASPVPAPYPSGPAANGGNTNATPAAPVQPAPAPVADDQPDIARPAAELQSLGTEVSQGATAISSLRAVPSAETAPASERSSRQHRAAQRRPDTERIFSDLANLAGIPEDAYAVGEEVEGVMCLLETDQGYEVFLPADGVRHELQTFDTEEAACFYLFGVLAAEAVRTGALARVPDAIAGWKSQPA